MSINERLGDYKLLYALYLCIDEENQSYFEQLVNIKAPNKSVCPRCYVDDFQHVEGCSVALEVITDEKLKRFID